MQAAALDWRVLAAKLYRELVDERRRGEEFAAELTELELNETLERGYLELAAVNRAGA